MRNYFLFIALFSLLTISVSAQPSTEVYLFDFEKTATGYELINSLNVSNNVGYDNQPSFSKDGESLIFASTRNGQTDILWYDIASGSKKWITNTPGGEYSPVMMPDGKHISAVRLDPDGLQRLYKYSIESGDSEILISELEVGYYTWFFRTKIIAFVLGDPATIQEIDITNDKADLMYQYPGRSIHYIPGTKDYSFIDKSDSSSWKIMRAVPGNKEWTKEITITLAGSEDMVWLDMQTILMGMGNKLYYFDTRDDSKEWKLFADLSQYDLTGITRLATYKNKLSVVVSGK
jgi:hypothetical protein